MLLVTILINWKISRSPDGLRLRRIIEHAEEEKNGAQKPQLHFPHRILAGFFFSFLHGIYLWVCLDIDNTEYGRCRWQLTKFHFVLIQSFFYLEHIIEYDWQVEGKPMRGWGGRSDSRNGGECAVRKLESNCKSACKNFEVCYAYNGGLRKVLWNLYAARRPTLRSERNIVWKQKGELYESRRYIHTRGLASRDSLRY